MVLRQGDVLQRIGKMAELFDDYSPLQLQAAGAWGGQGFTLVGRLQYQYGEGVWTEWHALRADGSSAWLAEDNGAYVFSLPQPPQSQLPAAAFFRLGATTAINGQSFTVSANQQVALRAAQGELPHLPALGQGFVMVELRSQSASGTPAEVLSIDYGLTPPALSRGQAVRLEDLQLSGLRDASTKAEAGRQFSCPQCGAALRPLLGTTQSMTCGTCHSIIDLSQGMGAELRHATQDEPVQPLIALGSSGTLQGVPWQVVGYQHRMGHAPGDADEQFGWDEYLLYHRARGFCFLVDSSEGWSLVKPATGAAQLGSSGQSASYLGKRYTLQESYEAETDYVLGEFYWQVQRGQRTSNRDYADGKNVLSLEQSAHELNWSVGAMLASDAVAQAFGLQGKQALLQRSDAKPFAASGAFWMRPDFWVFVAIVLVMLSVSTCSSRCDPATQDCASTVGGVRTAGGSFGGFSTGGGHK